ncbi:hypothetical protein M2320_004689, partial [Rhodoblastus acidophilus]|nr:hypothetical protein [Rhodoblastus acidophilus]
MKWHVEKWVAPQAPNDEGEWVVVGGEYTDYQEAEKAAALIPEYSRV